MERLIPSVSSPPPSPDIRRAEYYAHDSFLVRSSKAERANSPSTSRRAEGAEQKRARRAAQTRREAASVVGARARPRRWIIQGALIRSLGRPTDGCRAFRSAIAATVPRDFFPGSPFLRAVRLRSQGSTVSCDDLDSPAIARLPFDRSMPCALYGQWVASRLSSFMRLRRRSRDGRRRTG